MEEWYRVLIQFDTILERFRVGYEFEEGEAHRMDEDHPASMLVSLGYLEAIPTPSPTEPLPEEDQRQASAQAPAQEPTAASNQEGE